MTYPKSVVALGFSILISAAGACGDLTTIKFDLPARTYNFDTASAGVPLPKVDLPSIPCTDDASCCALAALAIPGIDCAPLLCDPNSYTCALTATIETKPQVVDLKKEVSGLSSFSNQSVIDVTVSRILYDVTMNSMNVDLPPIELFVAPNGIMSASDPAAIKFGTVGVTPANTTLTNYPVTLDPAGQRAFQNFAHHFGTPFVFLARTTLFAPGGTPVPNGAVSLTVKGQLAAKPSL